MTESKIKKYKMTIWLPALVLLIGIGLLSPIVHISHYEYKSHVETTAKLNAETYSERMLGELNKGIAVTTALEQILISEKGEVNDFDIIAKNLMTEYIQSIQLAPAGIVTKAYPASEGDAVGHNIFEYAESAKLAAYSRDHDEVTAQGPFLLAQGGEALVIRNPVYLSKEDTTPESQEFWGFTVVIIKVPKIFENSVEALSGFGYEYRLSKKCPIDESDNRVVISSDEDFVATASHDFAFGCATWTLEVMPRGGTGAGDKTIWLFLAGMLIILLFAALTLFILILATRHGKYKQLAIIDDLTGLLNRGGFETAIKKYFAAHPDEPCVEAVLDIDDFKFVNDLYGHAVGDGALRHLAKDLAIAFPRDAILARSGGDEFNIILKGRRASDVSAALERFVSVERTFVHRGETHSYTVSLGYAEYPRQAATRAELSNRSDIALYEAKLRGKHGCLCYDDAFRFEKRTGLGFALGEVSEYLPGAFLIYKAEPTDDTLLFANNEMIKLAGCDSLDDFMTHSGGSFRNLLHLDDRERVEKSIWEQIGSETDGVNDYVKFRFARKDGTYITVLDHGRIVESTNYGKVFYVLMIDTDFLLSHYSEDEHTEKDLGKEETT